MILSDFQREGRSPDLDLALTLNWVIIFLKRSLLEFDDTDHDTLQSGMQIIYCDRNANQFLTVLNIGQDWKNLAQLKIKMIFNV